MWSIILCGHHNRSYSVICLSLIIDPNNTRTKARLESILKIVAPFASSYFCRNLHLFTIIFPLTLAMGSNISKLLTRMHNCTIENKTNVIINDMIYLFNSHKVITVYRRRFFFATVVCWCLMWQLIWIFSFLQTWKNNYQLSFQNLLRYHQK